MQYEKDGQIFTFELDGNMIADYEEAHEGYVFSDDLEILEEKGAVFNVIRRVAGFMGTDLDKLKANGLDYGDFFKILKECIKEMGFTSA